MLRAPIVGLLAVLALLSCRSEPGALDFHLSEARRLLVAEQFAQVLDKADGWIQRADRSTDLKLKWRFRLIKAEALLGRRRSLEALRVLTGFGQMPDGPEWARDRARQLILQAEALYHLSRIQEIPDLLDRASVAAGQAGALDLSAAIEMRRGALRTNEGNFAEAHNAYQRSLTLARQAKDRSLEAKVESNTGILLLAESRYDEAIPLLEHGRSIALAIEAAETAARAQGNLGLCYFRLGDYDNARARLDEAESEFSRRGNQFEVQIWTGSAGDVFFSTGDLPASLQFYRRALEIARQVEAPVWEGRWLSNLASVSILRNEWDAAERYNNEARALKSKTNDVAYQASSLVNAGQIAAGRGDPDSAAALFRTALNKDAEDPTVVLDAHAGLAGIYSAKGKVRDADAEFRNTIISIDSRQSKLTKDDYRLSWLDSLISFYQKYVDFLMAENQPDRALEAAESSRSKVLTSQPIRPLAAPGYRQLAHRTGAVLLEYWLSPDHSYLWVITPQKIICHILPPRSEILPLIRSYRAVVNGGRNPLDVAGDTGLKLYNALLAPAMADAGSATQFIIVPDGELYSLNFETLPDGNNANRYWIDRATIRISPSLNYLASNAPRALPRTAPKLLLIGDPVSSLPQYPHLEFARQEISAIAATMSDSQPVIVQGAAATPASYAASRPGDFGFIHFSAHAAAAAKRASALDSAVILSGPPDKCRLVARDVLAVPLNAELVTVSACRSAGGRTYGGEGLVGFAWAFMKAGAGNVIAGLWDVSDRSTVQLMTGLYRQIAAGVPVAEALRSSKLALIHGGGSYAKPFYWAPFQIYTARAN